MKHACRIPRIREVLAITYIGDVMFELKSATLKPTAHVEVGRVANMMNLFPHITIDVEVSLDTNGFVGNSQELREERVRAVKDALLRQGIDSRRIRTIVHGASHTLSLEDTISFKVIDR